MAENAPPQLPAFIFALVSGRQCKITVEITAPAAPAEPRDQDAAPCDKGARPLRPSPLSASRGRGGADLPHRPHLHLPTPSAHPPRPAPEATRVEIID